MGKSTVATLLHEQIDHSAHVDIDLLKRMISLESSTERTEIAHGVALSFIKELIARKFVVIVEEIFREKDFTALMNLVETSGGSIKTFFLGLPLAELIKRDSLRAEKVKGEVTISRLSTEIQPFKDDILIDVSGLSPEDVMRRVVGFLKE